MERRVWVVIVAVTMSVWGLKADATPQLSLGSTTAQTGQEVSIDLSLSGGAEQYAGVNAKLNLPQGVTFVGMSQGGALPVGKFALDSRGFLENAGNKAAVIAYSGEATFGNGVLLHLTLRVASDAPTGTNIPITFAANQTKLIVNSQYALSNATGMTSVLPITPVNGAITIQSAADSDQDGLPDWWEILYFGNLSRNGSGDFDQDGVLDFIEYAYGTNPASNTSLPTPPALTITSPNGGEFLTPGANHWITWNGADNGGPPVRIALYRGAVWQYLIAPSTANTGTYLWTIPAGQAVGPDYSIRIVSNANSAVYDVSDGYFCIGRPSITLTSPNGGEFWNPGTQHNITWTSSNNPGPTVRIALYRGTVWQSMIANSVSTSAGSYSWTIPAGQAVGADYNVKVVSNVNAAVCDLSDQYFSVGRPTITVTSPNGGEFWNPGTQHNVTWTSSGNPGSTVRVALYRGVVWQYLITASTPTNTGSYSWTIPAGQAVGADYNVKVVSNVNASVYDLSDQYFSIGRPTITVTSPNGGEFWDPGTQHNITWTSANNPGPTVRIALFRGVVWQYAIANSVSTSAGSYSWTVPAGQAVGADYNVKVVSNVNAAVYDLSDQYFSVGHPTVTVTSPNGSEQWKQGTQHNVTWTSASNPGATVRIALYRGTVWQSMIAGSVATGAGSYSWTIPAAQPLGTNYIVRVVSNVNASVYDVSNNNFAITSAKESGLVAQLPGKGAVPEADELGQMIREEVLPLSLEANADSSVAVGGTLALRLTAEEDAIVPESIRATLEGDGWSEDVTSSATWRGTSADSDSDGWVTVKLSESVAPSEVVTLTVGAVTVSGKELEPVSADFRVREAQAEDPSLDAPSVVEEAGIGVLADSLGVASSGVYRIGPAGVFEKPVPVQIPVPAGVNPDDLAVFYFSESQLHPGWYLGENVVGWMAPDAVTTAEEDGQIYVEILVNHSGMVQLGLPVVQEEATPGMTEQPIEGTDIQPVAAGTPLAWIFARGDPTAMR